MWLRKEGFLDRVAKWWAEAPQRYGNKSFIFFKMLQYIKEKLKQWNGEVFKNIFTEKFRLEKELGDLHQKVIEGGMREDEFKKVKDLNKEYSEVLSREEVFWRNKSRETWLKEGERNTKFLHNLVKVRRASNKIYSIKNANGIVLTKKEDICSEVVRFFSSPLVNNFQDSQRDDILIVTLTTITDAKNSFITRGLTMEEVRVALFSMGADKALR
ncbi:uncharacterized protein LOC131857941 [Cryptomeria japonica]|uniref:uncharacterized protein LOC131857941 n=1 Tax=Cryptomeria japonica TaxID=3369 RepID=UPI0027DA2B55|nr:uncharacterized protein LOC131857941 [Cryptomeria japonica]